MSNLLPIVFAAGQDEGIDPRVLPADKHKTVKNVRFRKDGRPQKRPGLVAKTLIGIAAPYSNQLVNFVAEYQGAPLIGIGAAARPYASPQSAWIQSSVAVDMGHWGPGESYPVQRNAAGTQDTPTICFYNGTLICAFGFDTTQIYYTFQSGGASPALPALVTGGEYPRLLVVNGIIYLFYAASGIGVTGPLAVRTWNPSTFAWSAATTLQTITGNGAFDVCAHGSSEFLLIWQQSATSLQLARYTAATVPTIVGSAVTIATNSSAQYPSVASISNTSAVFYAWLELTATQAVRFGAHSSTLGSVLAAPTAATAPVVGSNSWDQPGVNVTSATTATIMMGYRDNGGVRAILTVVDVTSAGAVSASSNFGGQRMGSKPFNGPLATTYAAGEQNFVFTYTPEVPTWEDQRTTYLMRLTTSGVGERHLYIPTALGTNPPKATNTRNLHLNDVVDTGAGFATALRTQLTPLVTGISGQYKQTFGIDIATFHSIFESQFYAARDVAMAGRALQISGGSLLAYSGTIAENGVSSQPVISAATVTTGSGQLTPSTTYLYRAVYEYVDLMGRRCRSSTSDPKSVTIGAVATPGVDLEVSLPNSILAPTPLNLTIYRSLAGQSTYHNVGGIVSVPGPGVTGGNGTVTFSDLAADTGAAVTEFIYTDGGVLDHTLPPPCTFMALCNGRLWLGGGFDRTVITASKLLVSGEPTQFSSFAPFNVVLPRKCTGVASIDGTVVAFAADAIFLVNGDGPNNQGVGTFNPPSALPTDVGCVDWRSVVETSIGVFFQGQRGIFLLPRGFNSPVFVGAPVEDTLRTYPLVTSATLIAPANGDELTVRFTVNDGGGVNPGAVLVYNLRTSGWIVDTLQTGEIVGPGGTWLGKWVQAGVTSTGVLANIYEEPTAAAYAEGAGNTFVPSVLATGDIRPFGVAGYGNFESVVVMGEYRGNANVVVSVSVDGVTADTYTFAVTSADAADGVVYLDVTPKIRKGCSIAITIQDAAIGGVATEGFIAQAVYLEVSAIPGSKRLAVARRA